MNVQTKIDLLWLACDPEFTSARFVAPVHTGGSYSKKVKRLAVLGAASPKAVGVLCQVVDDFRRFVMIVDDLIDEDEVRNHQPAFWTVHGAEATVAQGNWYFQRACEAAKTIGMAEELKDALRRMAEGVELEIRFENPAFASADLQAAWLTIVEKEAAFRRFLALSLGCPPRVVEAMWLDGVAAQILDDSLSAISPKDGREVNSDERLGRLTFMRAFGYEPEEAVQVGRTLKAIVKFRIQALGKETDNV